MVGELVDMSFFGQPRMGEGVTGIGHAQENSSRTYRYR